ncbi:hypothetical protein GWI33_014703 [Rhynchophorus ferrugineus]|uniref:Uncharacterized protein n=1 Tax=Rhynchophorus ferrugineus TaxID=354439 RepID=A0A834I118_RHYFE|nr:hypothetical protein GWI33_014703 [Rhynchophorus ferrugineus]
MERIIKIKTKSKPDVLNQYPSERRYSSTIVLGLSVVLLHLSICSIIMGGLILYKMIALRRMEEGDESLTRLSEKVERDMEMTDKTYFHYYINVPVLVSVGCFLMAFGQIICFIFGIFAWKKWYIDNNITYFFLTCSFSTLTSAISFLISFLTCFFIKFDTYEDYAEGNKNIFPLSLPLGVNIIVLSIGSIIWSILSTKIAYRGMRNSYPDDMVIRDGKLEICAFKRSNPSTVSTIPVEVINTIIPYIPKTCLEDLPKLDTKTEYQAKVDRFLRTETKIQELDNSDEKYHEM